MKKKFSLILYIRTFKYKLHFNEVFWTLFHKSQTFNSHPAAAVPLHVCWRAQTEPWPAVPLLCVPRGIPAGSRPWSASLALSAACGTAAPETPEHLAGPHLCILLTGWTDRSMHEEKWRERKNTGHTDKIRRVIYNSTSPVACRLRVCSCMQTFHPSLSSCTDMAVAKLILLKRQQFRAAGRVSQNFFCL